MSGNLSKCVPYLDLHLPPNEALDPNKAFQTTSEINADLSDESEESTDDVSTEVGTVEGSETETTVAEAVVAGNAGDMESPEETSTDSNDNDREEGGEIGAPPAPFNPLYICRKKWIFLVIWVLNGAMAITVYHSIMFKADLLRKNSAARQNPINLPLLLVPRDKWTDDVNMSHSSENTIVARRVVVVQTDTERCNMNKQCVELLNKLQHQYGPLKYNFLLSSDGYVYEALGWNSSSPLYSDMHTVVVAFIGNFQRDTPSYPQLVQLRNLLVESEKKGHLVNGYKLVGKKFQKKPSNLFPHLMVSWKQWDFKNSDSVERRGDLVNLNELIELFGI